MSVQNPGIQPIAQRPHIAPEVMIGGSSAVPYGPLMDDLEAWWELDGSDLENKANPGTHDLTDMNTVGSRTGVDGVGSAADFTAANEESYLFDRVAFATQTDWTVAYWVYHDISGVDPFDGADFSDDQTSGHYSYIYWDGASAVGLLHWPTMYNCDQKRSFRFAGIAGGAAWQHICWRNVDAEPRNLQLFVNGAGPINQGGYDGCEFANNSTPPGISCFALRNLGRNQAQAHWLDGGMQWFGMWSRKLTDAEIADLYNSGAGLGWPFGY